MLAQQFEVSIGTIVRYLRETGKVSKLGMWVPHELTEDNKVERVRIFTNHLQRFNRDPEFLDWVVTGDEKWILYNNPKRDREWVDKGVTPKATP